MRLMKQTEIIPTDEDMDVEDVSPFHEETKARADELIADLMAKIDPYDFQDLVAGVLQAMGYRTQVSDPGPDQGVDVIAHRDALGLETPKIKVQVKHRQSSAGGPDIRNLMGTLGENEKGLFVSTSGFTNEAKNEVRKSARVTLIDGDGFVNLLTEYYDKLDSDYKSLVPLRKIWVPVVT